MWTDGPSREPIMDVRAQQARAKAGSAFAGVCEMQRCLVRDDDAQAHPHMECAAIGKLKESA